MTSNPSSDKRQYQRFKSLTLVKAYGPSGDEIQSDSSLVNISEGGLLFYSENDLEPKSQVNIKIEIPDFHSSIEVMSRVAWVQRATERRNSYFVGVEFVNLDDSRRDIIRKLKDQSES